ncbi:hypothetical protein HY386_01710 [Candidatus Daviesbacteria bacterium]|nr:hypothetical protein [Candidatus Daviesbacteria bacterium]
MQNLIPNPCIKCGKERILSKTWKEYVGVSKNLLIHTLTVCPDTACQKLVDEDNLARINRKFLLKRH